MMNTVSGCCFRSVVCVYVCVYVDVCVYTHVYAHCVHVKTCACSVHQQTHCTKTSYRFLLLVVLKTLPFRYSKNPQTYTNT